jgi:hypothetical protein
MDDDAFDHELRRFVENQVDQQRLIASGRIATVELWEHLLSDHGWDANRRLSLSQADAEAWHEGVQPHLHLG